jgi:hypothetical protein
MTAPYQSEDPEVAYQADLEDEYDREADYWSAHSYRGEH